MLDDIRQRLARDEVGCRLHLGRKAIVRRGLERRYLLVGCLVAALAVGVLVGLVEVAAVEPRFGQPLALLIVAPPAFALFKRVSFRLS
jgi:hypothetical protein